MSAPLYPNEDLQKRLRELGVKGDLNLAELGEMLPKGYLSGQSENVDGCFVCGKSTGDGEWFREDTEADARCQMLIYLIENGLLKA